VRNFLTQESAVSIRFYKTFTTPQSPFRPRAVALTVTELGMELPREGLSSLPLYQDRHLSVNFREQLVLLDGKRLLLRKKEFDLFALLVQNAGQVVPRQSLLSLVWGYGGDVRTRTLDVHVRRLRSKLGCHADRYIETIFGIGYRFQPCSAADPLGPAQPEDSPSYLALPA
jgi:DNA-binding response OmpR family regulator